EELHRAATGSDDPEIRHQAGLLLGKGLWKGVPFDFEELFRGYFRKPRDERDGAVRALEEKRLSIGARRLRVYLERVFLYDPSPEVRTLALDLMRKCGILPSREPLLRMGLARKDPWSRRTLGLRLSRTGYAAEALDFLGPVPADPGKDPEAAREIARSLAALGRTAEAAALVRNPVPAEADDSRPDPWPAVDALLASGQPEEALARLLEAYGDQDRRVRFAALLTSRGFPETALKVLEDVTCLGADVLALRILARAGRAEPAARILERIAGDTGSGSPPAAIAARALAWRGMGPRALETLEKAERRNPPAHGREAVALVERARLLAASGRLAEAPPRLLSDAGRKALAVAPPEAIRAAAFLLEDAGKAEDALALLQAARGLSPESPGLSLAAAEILERAGRARDAQDALLAALPHLDDAAAHVRAAAAALRLAPAAGGLDDLAARLEKAAAALEADWRRRNEKRGETRAQNLFDARRVPLLGLLARIRAEQGKGPEARSLCNLAYLLAPSTVEDVLLHERVRVEGRIGGPESARFLALMLGGASKDADEADARRRIAEFPVDFWKPFVPRDPSAPWIVARQWQFREFMVKVAAGDERLADPLRLKALELLGEIPDGAGPPLLARLVEKGDEPVRRAALARLESLPPAAAAPALLEALQKTVGDFPWQQRVAVSLSRLPSAGETRKALEALAGPGKGRTAALAACALARQGAPGMAAVLEGVARNPDESEEARAFALRALSAPPAPERRALFLALLEDPEPAVRVAAAVGLALLGDAEGESALAREVAFGGDAPRDAAEEAAAAAGGEAVRRALAASLRDPDLPRDPVVAALEAAGPPGAAEWREVLDGLIAPDASEDLRLGTFLDALADGADPSACREGLACWMEIQAPGAETGPGIARAARLALHAGEAEAAERFHRRARTLLEGDEAREAQASLARLLSDFRREPEAARRAAEAARRHTGRGPSAADLEARALLSAGRKRDAAAVLEEALRDPPAPGRPWVLHLKARLEGK
ncbi:MAG: hypothetical protein MUC63_04720, partial [Planctomycetes bacterium]|nr:hypothetical protein [Planctomycetota bacterium]